jgi:hypothetical protein
MGVALGRQLSGMSRNDGAACMCGAEIVFEWTVPGFPSSLEAQRVWVGSQEAGAELGRLRFRLGFGSSDGRRGCRLRLGRSA